MFSDTIDAPHKRPFDGSEDVVLAYGVESDRVFGIPGEELKGVHFAREFVWWYNGHPDFSKFTPDLKSIDMAIVLGQADVDMYKQLVLQKSYMKFLVSVIGHEFPYPASAGLAIKDLHINIKEADLLKTSADEEEMKNNRIRRRVFELLSKASSSVSPHLSLGQRELYFTFFRKPEKFLESSDRSGYVDGVNFEMTTLKGSAGVGNQIAVGTGQYFGTEEHRYTLLSELSNEVGFPVTNTSFDALLESLHSTAKPFPQSAGYRILAS
ncbi:NADPH:adrenodoxin oxidoreductase, mitochondrial isoform X1 [Tanacetum coccineum]